MSLSVNTNDIARAAIAIEAETGRSCADSLNRAAKHIVIGSKSHPGAMQLTPKASKADISRVTDKQIAGKVVPMMRKSGRWPATTAQIARAVKRERARRNSSIKYLAFAGWNNAAKAVGGKGINKGITSAFSSSQAAKGRGTKATVSRLFAEVINTAPASERIGFAALEAAVSNAAKDLEDYLAKKLSTP